jgi:hypothetical protein
MLEGKNADEIGGPEPMDQSDAWTLFGVAGAIFMVCGGFFVFTQLAAPKRLSGATRSIRLSWQQRQTQIQQAVNGCEQSQSQKTIPTDQSTPR